MTESVRTILNIVFSVLAFIGAAAFWEFVAWWMHKHVMHKFGWILHEDHHKTSGRRLQRNDAYALVFAGCSFVLIFFGLKDGWPPMAAAGFGVALYGASYVTFHDIVFHRRLKWIKIKPKSQYMKRIIDNHRVHHSVVTRDGATSFGFLWAPRPAERPTGEIPENLQE